MSASILLRSCSAGMHGRMLKLCNRWSVLHKNIPNALRYSSRFLRQKDSDDWWQGKTQSSMQSFNIELNSVFNIRKVLMTHYFHKVKFQGLSTCVRADMVATRSLVTSSLVLKHCWYLIFEHIIYLPAEPDVANLKRDCQDTF